MDPKWFQISLESLSPSHLPPPPEVALQPPLSADISLLACFTLPLLCACGGWNPKTTGSSLAFHSTQSLSLKTLPTSTRTPSRLKTCAALRCHDAFAQLPPRPSSSSSSSSAHQSDAPPSSTRASCHTRNPGAPRMNHDTRPRELPPVLLRPAAGQDVHERGGR